MNTETRTEKRGLSFRQAPFGEAPIRQSARCLWPQSTVTPGIAVSGFCHTGNAVTGIQEPRHGLDEQKKNPRVRPGEFLASKEAMGLSNVSARGLRHEYMPPRSANANKGCSDRRPPDLVIGGPDAKAPEQSQRRQTESNHWRRHFDDCPGRVHHRLAASVAGRVRLCLSPGGGALWERHG